MQLEVATLLLEKGEDVKTIQELLGYADPATTLRIYAHVINKRKVDCAENLNGISVMFSQHITPTPKQICPIISKTSAKTSVKFNFNSV
ncbi:tyrosine-type recombinase/integrase [Syntrophomonas wolfei]|nr:tyrosine-type recombinase/integrase [Syntrophomonas wolfei]